MRRVQWMILLSMLVVLSACGNDAGDDVSTSLDITASEFEFAPASYRIPANTEVPLTFTNDGSVEHEWVIMTSPIETEAEFAEDLVLWEEEVEAGETKTVTIPPLEAGTYQIICGIEGHFTAGMKGELVVVESGG